MVFTQRDGRGREPGGRASAVLVKALLATLLVALIAAVGANAQPNVVLIVTDDQRDGTIGPELTPAIWSLLRERGVMYENAMVPTALCCPSRASILTGLLAHSTRVYGNTHGAGWETFRKRGLERRTIAVAFRRAGYRTGLVGKYLNGWAYPHVPPGWDVFEAIHGGYWNYWLNGIFYGEEPESYSTDVIAARAVDFVRTTATEQPLFLYFAPYGPHLGAHAAPRHLGLLSVRSRAPSMRERDVRDKPPWIQRLAIRSPEQIDDVLTRSAETMLSVDEAVAGIVGALEETGRLDDTLIVLLSDNGILYGEHRVYGKKALPYRAAVEVPMVARWDGHLPAGAVDRRLALNVDLAATVAAAAGIRIATEGLDLAGPVVRAGFPLEGMSWKRSGMRVPSFCGYRTARYMYVHYAGGVEELYDYRRDPQELRNKAGHRRHQALQARLRESAEATCRPLPPAFAWR
jgi:arylsulfatase A-like enzyme